MPVRQAMKLLLEESHKLAEEKALLKHEFKVGQSLIHPGFLRFHEIEVNRDHGFFTMDLAGVPSLKQHISSSLAGVQSHFSRIAVALSEAFHFMHEKGWLHRDIKPDNILVSRTADVKVIDFSLSTRVKSSLAKLFSGKQVIQGTRNYIAPETILKKPADERTDQYSLGITLFEVVTGGLPFAGSTPSDLLVKHVSETPPPPSSINPNLTQEAENFILKMIAKKPSDRFETMMDVAVAFRELKCFHEDPVTLYERMTREDKEQQTMSVDKRLDSRADAERTAKGIRAPVSNKKKKKPTASNLAAKQQRPQESAQQTAVPQIPSMAPPAQYSVAPPAPYPGMPGQPYPGQFVPGQPMPNPGQTVPVQPYPNQPVPGMTYPGQTYPGPPMPGQPYPPPSFTGYAPQPYPGQIHPGPPATGPIQQPTEIVQPEAPPSVGSEIPASSAKSPDTTPETAQSPAEPDSNTPLEATEEDVRSLMDKIE
ncbi:MAG: protein kinase [Fuerstiella sp.]|nr:protein kinase [Fuerstiella sp.]